MKSWSIAHQLIIDATERRLRTLCTRETQRSMKDSVHKLLCDTIRRLNVGDRFKITEDAITGRNGAKDTAPSEFIFSGIREARNLKSTEGCDRGWVEEAQLVSKDSWEIFEPTIRKENSEIWISFNPELDTDETYRRWVLQPPPGAVVVKVGYEDNKWLSEISRVKIEHLRATDPEAFRHIYGGECRSSVEGAIFGGELRRAGEEGRIAQVPYNRMRPVDTAWDLGRDCTAIWFFQAYDGWINLIDYYEQYQHELTTADFVIELQNRKYVYDTDWLPWDGIDAQLHHNMTQDRTKSIEMLLREAGRNVRICPKFAVTDRLNAARIEFPLCRFDQQKTADGVQALRHYQWGPIDERLSALGKGVRKGSEPLHNWASHGADAFCAAMIGAQQPKELVERVISKTVGLGYRGPGNYSPYG